MEIKFNKKLYTKEAIEEAITAYKELAVFSLADSEDYWKVKIDKQGELETDLLRAEFSNFVLANVKNVL